jgi:hypothetical protein
VQEEAQFAPHGEARLADAAHLVESRWRAVREPLESRERAVRGHCELARAEQ